jgi:tetratricopeptide (TPR) repeat protein
VTVVLIIAAGLPGLHAASTQQRADTAAILKQAEAALEGKRYADAADLFKRVYSADTSNQRAAYQIGWCYNELERFSEAIPPLQNAVRLKPSDAAAYRELGYAYRKLNRYSDSLMAYQDSLKTDPDSANAQYNVGWLYNEQEKYAQSIHPLQEAVRLDPKNVDALIDLAYAYRQLARYDDAIAAYTKAAELEPNVVGPVSETGNIYFSYLRQYDKAVTSYRRSLTLDPKDSTIQYNLGWALNELAKYQEAVAPLKEATRLKPDYVVAFDELGYAYYKLGQTYERMNQIANAKKAYEAAVQACKTVDASVGAIAKDVLAQGGGLIITADHGNSEQMWDFETNSPHTAHTTNPVPLILAGDPFKGRALRGGGVLADVAPTLLEILEMEQPLEMSGKTLLG